VLFRSCGARLLDANPAALELLGVADFDDLSDHAGRIFGMALVESLSLFAGVVWRGERGFTHRLNLHTADGTPCGVELSARAPQSARRDLGVVCLALTEHVAIDAITPVGLATHDATRVAAKLLKLAGQAGALKSKLAGQPEAERAGRLQLAIYELILSLNESQPQPAVTSNRPGSEISNPQPLMISSQAAVTAAAPASTGAQVLVVTDAAQSRSAVSTLLAAVGVAHETLAVGDDRFSADHVGDYDLVLADIVSADGDGAALARQVRGLGGVAAELPLVALTAQAGPAHRWRLLEAGYDRVLAKPLDATTLADEVRRWCGAGSLTSEAAEQPAHNFAHQAA